MLLMVTDSVVQDAGACGASTPEDKKNRIPVSVLIVPA